MGKLKDKTIIVTGASSALARRSPSPALRKAQRSAWSRGGRRCWKQSPKRRAKPAAKPWYARPMSAMTIRFWPPSRKTRAAFGHIDVLVNNAGTNFAARSIGETSAEQWRELMDINLTSAFVFTRAVLPEMKARGDGLIINLASRAGMFPSLGAGVAYSASKIGMEALNDVTNEEGNAHGVRACLFNPGAGNTPIIDRRPVKFSQEQKMKMIQSEDIAATVVFIASLPPRVNIDLVSMMPTKS